MSEYIGCRSCPSPSCKGCNVYVLATMLRRGAFDGLMNGNRSIIPTADVVEVVSGYHAGDVCIYGFGAENNSRAIVEIVRILNDERGAAEVKFHRVFVDDTGNGFFNYLLKSGNTMNASFKYLKNITPRVDGGKDNEKGTRRKMIKIENTDVYGNGWVAATRGMRNPMNSWDKSDSGWEWIPEHPPMTPDDEGWEYVIGENDLKLMKTLSKAGNDHGKFLRMINVTMDITAPLYWWKEFDTYKVGTVANSCSTMHKIHAKEFEMDDFSIDHLNFGGEIILKSTIDYLNKCRGAFLETKDKEWWWQMIQLLPSSYNQKRTVQLNYQVLKSMYHARKNHKLDEWHTLCEWMEGLPYFKEVCIDEN